MKFAFLQEGGPVPAQDPAMAGGAPAAPEAAPAEAAPQGNPEKALAQMAQQLVDMLMQQIGDPQAVMAVLQMAAEMVGQAAAPQEAPAYQRQGGRLVRIR